VINETENLVASSAEAAQIAIVDFDNANVPGADVIDSDDAVLSNDGDYNIGSNYDPGDIGAHRGGAEKVSAIIEAAEEISDPLDGLVEATRTDPGAPFKPAAIAALAALKKEDRAAFESLRQKLKRAGCRVTALDKEIAAENGDDIGPDPTQASRLVDLAGDADLFHGPDKNGYADIQVNGHRETWPIRSKGFKRWLTGRYFEAYEGAANSEALQAALNTIEAQAQYKGPEREVFVRVGGLDDRIYIDLGDDSWRVIEIDADGWRLVDRPPVRFRRSLGMRPLPMPVPGGYVDTLRSFLNVHSDTDFVLVVAWMLAVLRNRGPYPVLVLTGEQGSAKSSFSAILRALLDPNTAPLRALPREDRDLFIAATNAHVLAFDNVSALPAWMSDTFCRLATSGGFAVRQLYTDQDEVLFEACRPVILNGIEEFVTRPDLADRALILTLDPIPEERRRPEAELWAAFEAERPRILGALLDAVVEGLKRLPETHLPKLPRMADFALWATACETAFWPVGTFMSAYCANRDLTVDEVIDADSVASAVRMLVAEQATWVGTATDLLDALAKMAGERITKSKNWPNSPRALSGALRRAATFLRKIGINISFDRQGRGRARIIHITATGNLSAPENGAAQPSAPSANPQTINPANGFALDEMRTVGDPADGSSGGDHAALKEGDRAAFESLVDGHLSNGAHISTDNMGSQRQVAGDCGKGILGAELAWMMRTVGDPADGSSGGDHSIVRDNSLKPKAATDADGADATCPAQSMPKKAGWRGKL
jgi:hypothetical protein